MKFLAILKDSFREAIDAKVFYVMVGLSVLATLLALCVSFEPEPGGQRVVEDYAVLPLNADASNLNEAQTARVFIRNSPVAFAADSVQPLDGAPDLPASAFQVVLRATYRTPADAEKAKADPAAVEKMIQEKFGLIEGRRMMEATDVHFVEWQGDVPSIFDLLGQLRGQGKELTGKFTLTARPTNFTWRFWPHKISLFFGAYHPSFSAAPLYEQVYLVEDLLVGWVGSAVAVLVSIVITAFFIPNMLRKGSVDLLLVKPINRVVLLIYKYVGGLTFIFLNTAVAVGGLWLAIGLRSGIWAVSFLETIFVLTFFFAILYSASTLFGVVTRSPIAAILLTCGLWAFMLVVGMTQSVLNVYRTRSRFAEAVHKAYGDEGLQMVNRLGQGSGDDPPSDPGGKPHVRLEDLRFDENWFTEGVSFLHQILPRTGDLYTMTARQLQHDLTFGDPLPPEQKARGLELPGGIKVEPVEDKPSLTAVFINSGAFIVVMLGLACVWFAMTDY